VKKFQFHPITEVKRVKALKDFTNVRNGLLAHPLIHPFAEFTCSHATRQLLRPRAPLRSLVHSQVSSWKDKTMNSFLSKIAAWPSEFRDAWGVSASRLIRSSGTTFPLISNVTELGVDSFRISYIRGAYKASSGLFLLLTFWKKNGIPILQSPAWAHLPILVQVFLIKLPFPTSH